MHTSLYLFGHGITRYLQSIVDQITESFSVLIKPWLWDEDCIGFNLFRNVSGVGWKGPANLSLVNLPLQKTQIDKAYKCI